jgi:hypothetical protein
MKSRSRLFFAFAIIVTVLASGCASQGKHGLLEIYTPRPDEALYGTWANPDYISPKNAKFVIYAWGYSEIFDKIESQTPGILMTYHIFEKWTDSDNNVWYKMVGRSNSNPHVTFCYLVRISEEESTYEETWRYGEFPSESELVPTDTHYKIFYRQ